MSDLPELIADVVARADAGMMLCTVQVVAKSLTMTEPEATVVVIDDDPAVREALGSLLRSVGLQARLFASVPEFLQTGRPNGPTCLVLDVRLPGRSGLDFQRELTMAGMHLPIIFMTGHGDIPMSVQAMKGGAIEFLTKPFRDQDLLDAIELGLARDRAWQEEEQVLAGLRARFETLSPREREVMASMAEGKGGRQIAEELLISTDTVRTHIRSILSKLDVHSSLEAVCIARSAGLRPAERAGAGGRQRNTTRPGPPERRRR